MSETLHTASFLDLPPEICIQILSQLEWNELLVAQRVSKAFKTLIETSMLQYRISLGIAGYEDGPDSHPMPVAERLSAFRALQSAFSRLEFRNKSQVELSGFTPTYELQRGVFLQGRHSPGALGDTIGINAWSFHDPTHPHAWRLPDLKGPIRDLTLDPSQDLLVLIEGGQPGELLSLHFLSLATGETHPLTKGIQKVSKRGLGSSGGFNISICGDLVGLLWMGTHFYISNWKSGKAYIEHTMENLSGEIDDFFFLDHERFVVVASDSNPPMLKVCQLCEDKPLEGCVIAIYHLPLLEDEVTLEAIQARSDPPPQANLPCILGPIFTTPPYSVRLEDRIIILTMDMHGPVSHNAVNLVMRAETLMNIPDAARTLDGPAIVTSTMWMNQTRLTRNLIPQEQWMCYCYGSRMVVFTETHEPGADGEVVMHVRPSILDFNPRLAAWTDAGKTGTPWDPQDDQRVHKGGDYKVFKRLGTRDGFFGEDWISDLPYIIISSEVHTYTLNPGESMVLMIDDQRFIALKMARGGHFGIREPRYMDIHTS